MKTKIAGMKKERKTQVMAWNGTKMHTVMIYSFHTNEGNGISIIIWPQVQIFLAIRPKETCPGSLTMRAADEVLHACLPGLLAEPSFGSPAPKCLPSLTLAQKGRGKQSLRNQRRAFTI